jgi:molybdate transport system ATP-binding protein
VNEGLRAAVSVKAGDFHLDVDLAVAPGETVAVVGPNGAGKSTLLRALAGLLALDGGRVTLDGTTLDDPSADVFVPAEARPIGVVFQDHLLFPHLTAIENVAFGLRSRGVPRAEARRIASAWLERVGLADRGGDRPRQLSGGQAQRVALARALATDPTLLLLDEPLSALDATTRVDTRRDLRRHLHDHPGVRVVVTHDPLDAAALADRIAVLEGGRIVQEGTLGDLTARPRSSYVADLVGVNLLAGRATDGRVEVGDAVLQVAGRIDGDVLLAIPPRAVTLSLHRPEGSARNVWAGTVEAVERAGDRARVRVVGPVTVVAEVTAGAVEQLALAGGSPVWVAVKATEIDASPA